MTHKPEILGELLRGCKTPRTWNRYIHSCCSACLIAAWKPRMDVHLDCGKHDKNTTGAARSNTPNGKQSKTVKVDFDKLEIETPHRFFHLPRLSLRFNDPGEILRELWLEPEGRSFQ